MRAQGRFAVVVVAAALACAVPAPALAGCLKCKVKGFVAAHARQDMDKTLSYLGEGFEFRDAAGELAMDRSAFRSVLEWDFAIDSTLTYEDIAWEGESVTAVFTETNELYALVGLEPQKYRLTFRFEDELVREMIAEPLPVEGAAIDEALKPFLDWASERHATELARIYPGGHVAHGAEEAATWLALLRKWKDQR